MDAHEILKKALLEKYKVIGRDYCYDDLDGKKSVHLTFSLEDYGKIPHDLRLIVGDFVFSRKLHGEPSKDGLKVECRFFYRLQDNIDVSDDITAEGKKKFGVICPKGKFYECGYAGHNDLEYWLEERSLISSGGYSRKNFEENGWVKLTGSSLTDVEFTFSEKLTEYNRDTKDIITLATFKLTKEQVDTMISYIKSLGRELIHYNYEFYSIADFPEILNHEDFYEFMRKYQVTKEVLDPSAELYKQK